MITKSINTSELLDRLVHFKSCVASSFAGSRLSAGVLLLPGPAVAADVFESALRAPAQAPGVHSEIGDADGGIARPTLSDRVLHRTTASGLHGIHNLQDGLFLTAAQVRVISCSSSCQQAVQSDMVGFDEIHYVDVITYVRAFGGGPVAAEHLKLCSAANIHLTHKREKVVGDAQRV